MKSLGYLTTQSVNAGTAAALAALHGLDLEIVEPRDLPRLQRERAELIVDWDSMPEDYQTKLLNGTAAKILAMHGYNLSDGLAAFLPRRGIICSRRLDHHLFRAVASGASAA